MTFAKAVKEAPAMAGVSRTVANRLVELAGDFASPEAFLASPKGPILSAWRRRRPGATRDLGARFWSGFETVRRLCATKEPETPVHPPDALAFLDAVVSTAELRTVLDMAEISGMGSLSVRELLGMVETVRRRREAKA